MNERHSAASLQISLAGSLPATLAESNNASLGPECRTPTGCSSRRMTQCCRNFKSPALATHSGEHLLLFHGPTVAVHQASHIVAHQLQTSCNLLCVVFQRPLTNCQQRQQVLINIQSPDFHFVNLYATVSERHV